MLNHLIDSLDEFLLKIGRGRKIFCLGAGIQGERFAYYLHNWNIQNKLSAFGDNGKVGSLMRIENDTYPIISVREIGELLCDDDYLIITSIFADELIEQISEIVSDKNINYYIFNEMAYEQLKISDYTEVIKESDEMIIPKALNYVWVGGEMPEKVKRNIDKWYKLCPDYEIKKWDETNYDISANQYLKQAYDLKKWGYVPDYLRLDVIYRFGGIYLDTDVELVKKPDELLYQECFGCFDGTMTLNLGAGFGAKPGCSIIKELRDYYDNVPFMRQDGTIDKRSCNSHSYFVVNRYDYSINDRLQKIKEMNIYPMIFQGANAHLKKSRITDKTFWIHYGDMSWM